MTKHSGNAERESESNLVDACSEFARKRGGAASAPESDDLAQESCLRALQAQTEVREPGRFLMRIARNLFIDGARRRKRERSLFEAMSSAQPLSERIHPERVLAGKQELRLVLDAIDALPPRCREAFTLHRFELLSYAAIARRMGVSTSMVEKHIAEAMRRIAGTLRGEEGGA